MRKSPSSPRLFNSRSFREFGNHASASKPFNLPPSSLKTSASTPEAAFTPLKFKGWESVTKEGRAEKTNIDNALETKLETNTPKGSSRVPKSSSKPKLQIEVERGEEEKMAREVNRSQSLDSTTSDSTFSLSAS